MIFAERAVRWMPGSIKGPTCRIWIQLTMTRRRSGERGKGNSERVDKVEGRRRSSRSGRGVDDEATGRGRGGDGDGGGGAVVGEV